jgi:hypothetical protein
MDTDKIRGPLEEKMRFAPIESIDDLDDLAREFRYVITDIIWKARGRPHWRITQTG